MQNRRIVNGHFADAGATVAPAVETNSVFTLCALVRSGYWSSVLPHGFLPLLSGVEKVAILPLEGPAAAHTVGVVVSDRDPLQPTATALLDVLSGLDWSRWRGHRDSGDDLIDRVYQDYIRSRLAITSVPGHLPLEPAGAAAVAFSPPFPTGRRDRRRVSVPAVRGLPAFRSRRITLWR